MFLLGEKVIVGDKEGFIIRGPFIIKLQNYYHVRVINEYINKVPVSRSYTILVSEKSITRKEIECLL